MADNSVLDSILEDALQEYESVDNAASAAATTVTTAPEPTAPASESAEKSQSRDEERLFPPSSDEIAATFQALMTQLGASADAPNADDTSVPPPASSSSSSSSSGPISDAAAEAQADEALKDYLSAISAGPSDSGNDDSAASFDSNTFGALLGLLKPFISKELLYGPFSQMRTLVNSQFKIFVAYDSLSLICYLFIYLFCCLFLCSIPIGLRGTRRRCPRRSTSRGGSSTRLSAGSASSTRSRRALTTTCRRLWSS